MAPLDKPGEIEMSYTKIIVMLLKCLPDSISEDESWRWAWNELSDKAQEQVKEARRATDEFLRNKSPMITLGYDSIVKVGHLNCRRADIEREFTIDTCCDYVDSLHCDGDNFGVTMFVEPCGNITKLGRSFDEVLDWWIAVFSSQPDWDYCRAGWHLDNLASRGRLPDNPAGIWHLTTET